MEMAEDEYSIAKHTQLMEKEMQKARPNCTILEDLMGRTTSGRAKAMETATTAESVESFPFLRIPSLLLHEAKLRYDFNLQSEMTENLGKLYPNILKKSAGTLHEQLMATIEEELEETRKKGLQKEAALLLLPGLFKENNDLLFTHNKDPRFPSPTLKVVGPSPLMRNGSMVIMDGQSVVDTKNLDITDCVSCLFATYFIHGIAYPKGLKNTLLFLERYVFNIKGAVKLPVTVVKQHAVLSA